MSRVHRLGQTKPVWVYRFVSAGTVEERILQRAQTKLVLDTAVLTENLAPEQLLHGLKALYEIVRLSAFGVATRPCSDRELERLLDRSRLPGAVQGTSEDLPEPRGELHDVFTVLGKRVPRDARAMKSTHQIGCAWWALSAEHLSSSKEPYAEDVAAAFLDTSTQHKRVPVTKLGFCYACAATTGLSGCWNHKCNVSLCSSCLKYARFSPFSSRSWTCPLHECAECDRKPGQSGGALFRCMGCPRAWCEVCLPGGLSANHMVSITDSHVALGYAATQSQIPMICTRCFPRMAQDIEATETPEPAEAMDLSSFEIVGDADKMFAFLQ